MKKKILSLMLAMVMMLSLSVTALADTNPDPDTGKYADEGSITIGKNFVLADDAETSAKLPTSWSFDFTIVASDTVQYAQNGVVAPTISNGAFTITSEDTNGVTLTLPEVSIGATEGNYFTSVGIYTYTISEVISDGDKPIAGVTYETASYTMKITVMMNEDGSYSRVIAIYKDGETAKQDTEGTDNSDFDITNTYKAYSLTIHKDVKGTYGDKTDTFTFEVTFTGPTDKEWVDEITLNGATLKEGTTSTYVFTLGNNEDFTFNNIPDGVSYEVVEVKTDAQSGYTTTMQTSVTSDTTQNDGKGTFDGSDITETVTNEKDGTPDTGISLDSLPYILMLIVVAAGVVVMISRRRLDNRF